MKVNSTRWLWDVPSQLCWPNRYHTFLKNVKEFQKIGRKANTENGSIRIFKAISDAINDFHKSKPPYPEVIARS